MWDGDHDRALALLHNVDAPGSAVMRARVWLRLEHFERVVSEYDRRALECYAPAEATGLACCAAVAYASLGDTFASQTALDAAKASVRRSDDQLLALHCGYTGMLVHLLTGDVAASRLAAKHLRSTADELSALEPRTPYQWELAHLRARIFQHDGRHRQLENDRRASEECFSSALMAAESAHNRDRFLEAQILALLSASVGESPLSPVRTWALSRASGTVWSAHTERSGNSVKAAFINNRRLFGSREVLPASFRGTSSLASRFGERVDALFLDDWPAWGGFYDECRFAVSLALDIDWERTSEHEALHLLRFAIVLCPHDPSVARRMFHMYETRIAQLSPNSATIRGPERAPLELFARACLEKADGGRVEASFLLSRAARMWRERGLDWAASVAGLERYGITREESDCDGARRFVSAFPTSSFARRLRGALEDGRANQALLFPYLGLYCSA